MAEEDNEARLAQFWSEIFTSIIYDYHSLKYDILEEEQTTTNESYDTGIFKAVDLGLHCIQNRGVVGCDQTLKWITTKIDCIVNFTNMWPDRAALIRENVKAQLMRTLAQFFGSEILGCPLTVYGSYDNGLRSDIDNINIYVEFQNINDRGMWKKIYDSIDYKGRFTRIKLDTTGSQPLLVLRHNATDTETVVSFTDPIRPTNSVLMKTYLNLNALLKPVILYLKHILTMNDIFGQGKITSYHLFWLVTFFFQRKHLVPSVNVVINLNNATTNTSIVRIDDRWNFTPRMPENTRSPGSDRNSIEESAASLFLDFVGFYTRFDFLRYVISPYTGQAIPMHRFDLYGASLDTDRFDKPPFVKNAINFQDPTELHRNLFDSIPIAVANTFKAVCRFLYWHYHCTATGVRNFDVEVDAVVRIPHPVPITLTQFVSFTLNGTMLPPEYVLVNCVVLAVRLVMENCLKFTKVRIIRSTETKFKSWISVVYFHYTSYTDVCNGFTALLISRQIQSYVPGHLFDFTPEMIPRVPLKMTIVCEIYDSSNIVVLMEGTGRLIEFFDAHGRDLFQYVLSPVHL